MFEIKGTPVPLWAFILSQAERFGVTPWDFEQGLSGYWYNRISIYSEVMNEKHERDAKKANG